jgi:calcineurin-like phosphoesterase family protein
MARVNMANSKSVFFTSDTHFGHKNIIKYCDRPFSSTEEMQEAIVAKWNETVKDTDTVFHLGDFSFLDKEKTRWILSRLNGNIVLVRGNHDASKHVELFGDVYDMVELHVEDNGTQQIIILCHYPLAVWASSHYGTWHLHGHSHGTYKVKTGKIVDAGWDVWGKPVSYQEVKDYMAKRSLSSVDHHSISEYRNNAGS